MDYGRGSFGEKPLSSMGGGQRRKRTCSRWSTPMLEIRLENWDRMSRK